MPYVYTVNVQVSRGSWFFKKKIGAHRFVDVEFANPVHAGETLCLRPGGLHKYDEHSPIYIGRVIHVHHSGRMDDQYKMYSVIDTEYNYPLLWKFDAEHHGEILGLLEKKLKSATAHAVAKST